MISDEKGIFSVGKIRNKTFETSRFLNGRKLEKKF
jgi:branched-chain amino acid aminotransferase